jgi:hypothetical protein
MEAITVRGVARQTKVARTFLGTYVSIEKCIVKFMFYRWSDEGKEGYVV